MPAVRSLVVAVLTFVAVAMPAVVLAAGRVALVVGNSTYLHIGHLPDTQNDAADMSAALRRLGFEVTTELDADRVELTEALRQFTRRSAGADVSLVFYAGHGIEMDGVNYLVPVDARLERDVDVRFETVTLDDLLVSTAAAAGTTAHLHSAVGWRAGQRRWWSRKRFSEPISTSEDPAERRPYRDEFPNGHSLGSPGYRIPAPGCPGN